jgi:MoaA/NifB/PqqE/SkfB family radical SAM enzyme
MIDSPHLVTSKENQTGELIVILFEFCNLSCQMCSQNHNDKTGIDSVVDKFDSVKRSLDALKLKGKTSSNINLMGGELLADDHPDYLFNDYAQLINKIQTYADSIYFPIRIQIASNFVWTKTERIKRFLDLSAIKLTASYDPAGRFNNTTFEIFKNNIIEFKDYIVQIGTVMTAPTIKRFIDNSIPFFDYLYNNFDIVFDHFTPEGEGFSNDTRSKFTNILLPTDVELRDFYKFMINKWPNCYPFKDTMLKIQQPMSCMSTVTIHPTSAIKSCAVYDVKEPVAEQKVVFFGKLAEQKMQWLEDYDCLSCIHMQRCSFGCFLNHHTKNIRTQETCWLQEVYDYADTK